VARAQRRADRAGPSGVCAQALPDRVPLLQHFAAGETVEAPGGQPPCRCPLHSLSDRRSQALYWEGYMALKPAASSDEITRWFWGETALGQLLRRVRERLDAAGDPASKAAAFGIAR
jgi:hypothetical protein